MLHTETELINDNDASKVTDLFLSGGSSTQRCQSDFREQVFRNEISRKQVSHKDVARGQVSR